MDSDKKSRNALTPLERVMLGSRRRAMLESHGWYKGMTGRWVHPHCMDMMSRREILALSPAQLEYKLKHGSHAALPPELAWHER